MGFSAIFVTLLYRNHHCRATRRICRNVLWRQAVCGILLFCSRLCIPALAAEELLLIHEGDLPIIVSAPHGGQLTLASVPARTGDGLASGPSGFFAGRDIGTEELALEVVRQLERRFQGKPSYVISRVHRRYVDFNRPPEIAMEHERARVVYDQYHMALRDFCRRVQQEMKYGLLIDLHGQGSSSVTVYRGTKNGMTVSALRERFGETAQTGSVSLFGLLKQQGWTVHPDPHDGREQSGFSGGFIVQTYGSHRGGGIDAVQLEFGSRYRVASKREQTAVELTAAIAEYVELYLPSLKVTASAVAE